MTDLPDPRAAFDAALIPGMRERLAAAYHEFRRHEAAAIAATAPPSAGGNAGEYLSREAHGELVSQFAHGVVG